MTGHSDRLGAIWRQIQPYTDNDGIRFNDGPIMRGFRADVAARLGISIETAAPAHAAEPIDVPLPVPFTAGPQIEMFA